jgi:GNAT superfamily N-acetyltransferase
LPTIERLSRDQIELIWTIDRGEVHHHVYKIASGELVLVDSFFDVPGWHPDTVGADTPKLYDCFDRGGTFLGAFDADALVGVAVLDPRPVGSARDHLQLLYLYVSRASRGRGVGSRLFAASAQAARAAGAKALYISSTPTENTVNFYVRRGASLIEAPDPKLLAAEPHDIHLTYRL